MSAAVCNQNKALFRGWVPCSSSLCAACCLSLDSSLEGSFCGELNWWPGGCVVACVVCKQQSELGRERGGESDNGCLFLLSYVGTSRILGKMAELTKTRFPCRGAQRRYAVPNARGMDR